MEPLIVFAWFFLCVIVGVAANTRGRSGVGWFLLSFLLLSPLLGGLLLLALPRHDGEGFDGGRIIVEGERQKSRAAAAFVVLALIVLSVSAAVFMAYRIV